MTFDVTGLTKAIQLCFDDARDIANFNDEQRMEMLFRGKILRGHLVNLISAQWEAAVDPQLAAANAKLAGINDRLQSVEDTLKEFADTVERLAELAKDLEALIKAASQWV